MGFNLLLADNDANYSSLLKKGLMDAEYCLYQAESREMALQHVSKHRIDAAIVDLDLPGGVKELLLACLNNSMPILTIGNQPSPESECQIELMYHGIPYMPKLDTGGIRILDNIIMKINRILKRVLIFSTNEVYQRGVAAGLHISGYNVIIADKSSDLIYLYTAEKPQAIIVYFPEIADLHHIRRIRKMDGEIPIIVVAGEHSVKLKKLLNYEMVKVIPRDMVVRYLEDIWLKPCIV